MDVDTKLPVGLFEGKTILVTGGTGSFGGSKQFETSSAH